ncbi:MAG: Wzy polymerase domain-containing protein [Pseudomonadota bacterium]|nr:Wzy polymerase domain-containing protein [Pseudomonadota bacterium]
MTDAQPGSEGPRPRGAAGLTATACAAIAFPSLIAFNVAPSATFFNQAAAFVGWGGFLLVAGLWVPKQAWPRSSGASSLLAAMAILFLAALAASPLVNVPWSLSLSSAGTIASAILAIGVGTSVERAGLSKPIFRAFCVGMVVAGVANSLVGLVQVFAPTLPDGDWVALSAIPGRATGNLRQPNHLSSLLIWSIVAAIWIGESRAMRRSITFAWALVFIYVIVLTASRTGAVGMLTLAAWGLLDRRLSRSPRLLLVLAPVAYATMWWGTSLWATHSHQMFGGQTRFATEGDVSNARFPIWANTLSLAASHPWFGVGFGDFNFAWTLTPFPGRPTAFFDHTHNIVLNFAVELGLPIAALVLSLMLYALWSAFGNAKRAGQESSGEPPAQRAAFVMVIAVAVHSMFEYPLWYAYFLLPAAFAFGLCLERPVATGSIPRAGADELGNVTRPYVIAAMFLILGGTLALYDYMRVVVIFAPPAGAGPLEQRIADGRKSILFAHHADYAAATVAEHPGDVMEAFARAPHYLLDARLMMAWAKALDEQGETDKARYLAARLMEFHNDQADEFFAACAPSRPAATASLGPAAVAAAASTPAHAARPAAHAASAPPFQCLAPTRALRFEDFR